ncbi:MULTISPECIES: L-rhamnose mutarotase [Pseudoxanthomonas]|jgi:L-rhamnose mutarotase|uniref:L-rhamnose mutarotase n=1 Tax=Pseudoxanthomonas TaxID=83618 RepID=UPI0016158475|nr:MULTISPECIES: L-rhamnose mutarotase [Pseudoxanthomonas]MBB3276750.1 L-rhamnose mutarotase [Pseudoxanthomonas sp. OG2]MBD9378813.1 L-rhamnose mutarotase [Pseudoxanthomonas sp. PXM04]MBV7472178.1 L-rhamnose mutarotase [Pseudoxanthomonas sp. PXM05]UBB25593.1 L-rhamnose mutarotase [Pseudoxanthomonas japonensis]
MRHCLALDLHDDPDLIAAYEHYHRQVWPEVLAHLRTQGVRELEIFRLGTRMVMVMDTDDAVFDAARMADAERDDPRLRAWEDLMWSFQKATPWTPEGTKWTPMQPIFRLTDA